MKKRFLLPLLLLLLTLAPEASAETTILTVDVPVPDYELNIPASVVVDHQAESCQLEIPTITGDDSREGIGIRVSITSSSVFTCSDVSTTIPFNLTLSGAEDWQLGDCLYFSSIESGVAGVTASGFQPTAMVLSFQAADWDAALPGTYTATITYTVTFAQVES